MAKGSGYKFPDVGCLSASLSMIRFILCIGYIAICCGPILIIIGILFITAQNTRKNDVEKFNKIIGDAAGDAFLLSYTNGRIWTLNSTLETNMKLLVEKGITNDYMDDPKVKDFTSTSLEALDVNVQNDGSHVRLDVTIKNGNISKLFSITQRSSLIVIRTLCPSCDGQGCECSKSERERECKKIANGSCINGDCSQCVFRGNLRKICLVLKRQGSFWDESSYKGCEYPFNDRGYYDYKVGNATSMSQVKVWADSDPQFQLDLMTKGARKFGKSSSQFIIGLVLLAVGIGSIIIQMGIVGFIISASHRRQTAQQYILLAAGWQPPPYETNYAYQSPPIQNEFRHSQSYEIPVPQNTPLDPYTNPCQI